MQPYKAAFLIFLWNELDDAYMYKHVVVHFVFFFFKIGLQTSKLCMAILKL